MNRRIYWRVPIVWLTDAYSNSVKSEVYFCQAHENGKLLYIVIDTDAGWQLIDNNGFDSFGRPGGTTVSSDGKNWLHTSNLRPDGTFKMLYNDRVRIDASELPGEFAKREMERGLDRLHEDHNQPPL